MSITCNLTESDYRAFRRYVIFRLRKLHWFFAVVMVTLLAFVWFSNKPGTPLSQKIVGELAVVIIWGILMLIFLGASKLITRFTGGRFLGSTGPHTFEIGEETFAEINAQGRQEVRIAGLRRVAEPKNISSSSPLPARDTSFLKEICRASIRFSICKRKSRSQGLTPRAHERFYHRPSADLADLLVRCADYPVRSFICRVLLFTLISAPMILVALYYYDRNEIGAEPDPSSDPYMEFVVGSVISIVLGFILSFVIVSAHRLCVRIWKSRSAA